MSLIDDSQIIADFVVESREHLADVENQLLAIEAAGADIDVDLVNQVFRAVHSIKGAAGFLGFAALGRLAHELESVLNLIRNRQLVPDATITDALLRAADVLRRMIEDVEHSNEVDIAEHETELQGIVAGLSTQEPSDPCNSVGSKPDSASPPIEKQKTSSAPDAAAATISPPVAPPPVPAPAASATTAGSQPDQQPSTAPGPVSQPDTNIRVAVSVLDRLMNLAGELVLSRNQLLQTVNSAECNNLDSVAARMDQVTSELQETIMQTRMQVIGTVFNKFPRVVRDLSNQLGKQCRLTVEGQEVELDKSIIETIGDPLTHLIRNAVDHGIESPQDRIAAGKTPEGTIVLRAFHQAGKVNISISDDGHGIDAARLKEKAVTQGLITPEQSREMSDREAVRLIFHPGFSMAAKVTGVSGRGVGMDVVKTNIEKLGGAVGIETQPGRGTTIDVKLPLTLAIVPSLVVRCGGRRFAIPQASISELVRIKAEDVGEKIQRVKSAEVFRLRGALLPLVRLDKTLGAEPPHEEEEVGGQTATRRPAGAMHIIVVETGHLRYGLIVDGLHDSEEIVVKPLGRHMQNCHCLSGATILGDGRVALILDVVGIASYCQLKQAGEDERDDAAESAVGAGEETQTVLLFTNNPKEHFGVPMELISRLERIRSEQIDSVGGMEVLQYRGVSLPLLRLENHITAQAGPQADKLYIVVFKVLKREVGLIVPQLVDIHQASVNVDTVTFREPGVIGSVIVDDRTTRLLDLFELTQAACPDWFGERKTVETVQTGQGERTPTILVAEDSGFFLKQLTGFLEADGYEVVGCEDGLVAWNTLRESDRQFDLVITDIEMPNMNGFELSRKIKDDPTLAHLPIIAVTSLASEEDVQHGKAAGIDEYQIKLDREQLMAAVAKHLQETGQPVATV